MMIGNPLVYAGAVLFSLTLTGCGFSPLYGSATDDALSQEALGQVSVALIPNRSGQVLRQDLQEQLERDGADVSSRYDLYVFLSIGESDIGITPQSASTHSRLIGAASWVLRAKDASHSELANGSAHSLDGFDVINQQFFAADMSRDAASSRIDEALASQITQQLAVYFRGHKAKDE